MRKMMVILIVAFLMSIPTGLKTVFSQETPATKNSEIRLSTEKNSYIYFNINPKAIGEKSQEVLREHKTAAETFFKKEVLSQCSYPQRLEITLRQNPTNATKDLLYNSKFTATTRCFSLHSPPPPPGLSISIDYTLDKEESANLMKIKDDLFKALRAQFETVRAAINCSDPFGLNIFEYYSYDSATKLNDVTVSANCLNYSF